MIEPTSGQNIRHHEGAGCLASSDVFSLSQRRRLSAVRILFLLVLAGVCVRLCFLHVASKYKFAEEDVYHIGKAVIQAPRGDIYDRGGRLLATDRETYSLSADPRRILSQNVEAYVLAARLHLLLGLDEEDVYERLTRRTPNGSPYRFVWIKRWLTSEEVRLLGDPGQLEKEGLSLEREPTRYYPEGQLAAHVLGFVNREQIGGEGIEALYDSYLQGKQGVRVARKDAKRNLLLSQTLDYEPARKGDNLYLTLDSSLQSSLEKALDEVLVRCEAERASGVFLDPATGAILAMANRPAFDPNEYWAWPEENRVNRVMVDVFEPGSSFKIVTAAAALEEQCITPDDLVDCEGGTYTFFNLRRIRDVHRMGIVPFRECFAESSNIAMIKVANLVGPVSFDEWIRRFGFGEATGCGYRPESSGMLAPRSQWTKLSMVSLPLGQEVAVTILQLARAYAAIANGGYLVRPYLVEKIVDADGKEVFRHEPEPPRRILHEETAATLRELCHGVVTHGTGVYANIPEYRVGGKTGTAQIARPKNEGGGYYEDRYTAVFAGFAPLADPRLCGVIVVRSPMRKPYYGGYVCGPVFKKVVREALIRMNCPPDPVQVPVKAPAMPVADADTGAQRLFLQPMEVAEDEQETDEFAVASPFSVTLKTDNSGEPSLPDFRGLTKRQAKERIASLGIQWTSRGSGWVVYQDPPAGTPLYQVSVCRLYFSNTRLGFEHETTGTTVSGKSGTSSDG